MTPPIHSFTVGDVTYDLRAVVSVAPNVDQADFVDVIFAAGCVVKFAGGPFEKAHVEVTYAPGSVVKFDKAMFTNAHAASVAELNTPEVGITLESLGAAPVSHQHTATDLPGLPALYVIKSTDELRQVIGAAPESHAHTPASISGLSAVIRALLTSVSSADACAALQAAIVGHGHTLLDIEGAGPVFDIVASAKSAVELRDLIAAAAREHTHTTRDLDNVAEVVRAVLQAGSAADMRNILGLASAARCEVSAFAQISDTRLSDARAPLAHTHEAADVSATAIGASLLTARTARDVLALLTLGTAALANVPDYGDAAPAEVVRGNDSRLADTRAPAAHGHALAAVSDLSAAWLAVLTGKGELTTVAPVVVDTPSATPCARVSGAWVSLPVPLNPKDFAAVDHTHSAQPNPAPSDIGAESVGVAAKLVGAHMADPAAHGMTPFGANLVSGDSAAARKLLALGSLATKSETDVVAPNDPRLYDPRQPQAHRHNATELAGISAFGTQVVGAESSATLRDILGLRSAAACKVPEVGNALPTELVRGSDSRLSDARVPQPHVHSVEDLLGFSQGFLEVPVSAEAPEVAAMGRGRIYMSPEGLLFASVNGAPYKAV